jgi:hypothetical protein
VSKFNPDVRNICLVDVIALRTPSVVVSPDPVRLEQTPDSVRKSIHTHTTNGHINHYSLYLEPVRESRLVDRISSDFTQVT